VKVGRGLADSLQEFRGIRMTRSLGPPALAAMGLSAIGSSVLYILGVVADEALGFTPFVFVASAVFFVLTTMTYVEANSIHPEQGGASTFARYAFNELWSFIAGWAILLDYLIVMALAAFTISHYLAAFWGQANNDPLQLLIAAGAIAWVVWANIRGITAERFKFVRRVGLLFLALCLFIVIYGLATEWEPGEVVNTIELGKTPGWDNLLFAAVLAAVANTGIEAASGLAPEVRVSRAALRKLVMFTVFAVVVILVGVSAVAVITVPIEGGATDLGSRFVEAPLLGVVSQFGPGWLREAMRYAVGGLGALVLLQAVNGTMLGVSRLTYSLATNRQIPSILGRLHRDRSTPYVTVVIAALVAFALVCTQDVKFLAGIFAFGAMLVFTIAHLSVIALRYREPSRDRVYLIPLSVRFRGGTVPLPALLGAVLAGTGWLSVVILHSGARLVGGIWMLGGIALYVIYRRGQDKSLTKRFTIPARALQENAEAEYGSILVPVFGEPIDDDIVGTAGRLAADEADEAEGGAVIEALYVVEVPMSLPLDARVPDERIAEAKRAVSRAKEVGEEYEGVVVATAMVRARSVGAAIVSEAKRRGVEAIVLAAEEPSRVRGGTLLGGRAGPRDRSVGNMTRYVLDKAPCRVILTAAPPGDEGEREGVAP
jgi:basic amino acid/polyamine antiporter, APA family